MPNPEGYGATVYPTADAAVGAADDAGPIIAGMLEHFPAVELKGFYSIRTSLVLPSNKEIVGRSRSGSGLVINADVNGLEVHRYSKVSNFRIRGTSAMTAASACLSVGEGGVDCSRSAFRDLIIGGAAKPLGDAASQDIVADAIRGGLSFLNVWERVYAFNARYGIDISPANGNSGAVINADAFTGCEFHSCVTGARFGRLRGVTFDSGCFEGNSEQGLVIGMCLGVDISGAYFEANNGSGRSGLVKADMIVDPALVGMGDPGGGLTISGCWFVGGSSDYAIWIERQRIFRISENGISGVPAYAVKAIGVSTDELNTGRISNNFAPDGIENGNPGGVIEG